MADKNQETMEFREVLPAGDDYWKLFQTTGWNEAYNFSVDDLSKAIQGSWYCISVYDLTELIGFGRVISDGVHHAFIVDLIIHPDYQGEGVGKQLLNLLVDKCKELQIKDIQLFAAKDKSGFYERNGFEKRPDDSPGMQYKKNNF